mmetsp:Transcript_81353/g.143569  ORF Transcript_81353/g.143569 Transcript_81353/m.143569 type:complete len:817 (+) Transcript_81353:69-2519(+)|eukprot:CAMPEP_0197622420 /NCGR_PEP_ID=MMETSP1338-20131121/2742_1 /TAXON_ID=43686 ORGANISM="Pelagodinium beii, Strain RCC1491" /NCGR_SAMPLE_ID=MMETSP1338 /ASSEMBLY_ACC=CAM_ASM_000754 /LENGTH=816 /DNA_ID=CAMNT_0043192153 /DNA_START=69 /DNA_END=2519 /DNA_ORIENTATION=-
MSGAAAARYAILGAAAGNSSFSKSVCQDGYEPHPELYRSDEFGSEYRGLWAMLILLFALLALFCVIDRQWQQSSQNVKKQAKVADDCRQLAASIAKAFMPSWKLEKYQFRGMRPKAIGIDIKFKDLSLELWNGRKVLEGVTGEFTSGRMCAIMGPSGAGKTTFMNVLCGKATYGKMGGDIEINEQKIEVSSIKSVLGFVPQDDIVHEELTVREQIRFSAELRNEAGTSKGRIQRITDDVLHVMQIDHIMNEIVGGVENRGISGGQRKRVNIGLELAAQPTLLFLDEPTSGLDATSSLAVVLSLKKMCQLGMSSIMVIHQPRYSLFTLFDDVLLLGKGGRTVYLGPSGGAKPYFESKGFQMPADENPADWFMDITSGEVANIYEPNFQPPMLFDMWKAADVQMAVYRGQQGRSMNNDDDLAVLTAKLDEEWSKIDQNKDNYLDIDELKALLELCSNSTPTEEVVDQLFAEMSEEGEFVTKSQFSSYLVGLRGDVARDPSLPQEYNLEAGESTSEDDSDEGGIRDRRGLMISKADPLHRPQPNLCQQMVTLVHRMLIQWWRKNSQRALFIGALVAGALVLGILDRFVVDNASWDAMTYLNTHTALALLISIYCLRIFGSDRPVFWREVSTGLSITGHFFSRVFMNLADLLLMSGIFTVIYYQIMTPRVHFGHYLFPYLLVTFVASGWGYFVSTIVPPQHGPFIVSLVSFVVCGLLGNPTSLRAYLTGGIMEFGVDAISITRWSVMMSFMYIAEHAHPQPKVGRQSATFCLEMEAFDHFPKEGPNDYWWSGTYALVAQGVVLHMLAYIGLRYMNRNKMV